MKSEHSEQTLRDQIAAWDNAWGQRDPQRAYKRGSQLLTRMARANGARLDGYSAKNPL